MNQETFKNTVFIHKDKLYRFARRILVSEDEAYDVVQDTLMKLWDKREQLIGIDNIEAYAMRMVSNECISRLRKFEVRENYKNNYSEQLTKENQLEELKPLILEYINQLPDKQRAVMHLRDVEEYELKEIAEILDLDPTAVRVNLTRARKKIKEQLEIFFDHEAKRLKLSTKR
jgi:RNA polymerase sigma factor (sigma-70 family)